MNKELIIINNKKYNTVVVKNFINSLTKMKNKSQNMPTIYCIQNFHFIFLIKNKLKKKKIETNYIKYITKF